jgi:hypothetical protein
MLKPHIWLRQKTDDAWRDNIGMNSEGDWRLWFENYERFILHYAHNGRTRARENPLYRRRTGAHDEGEGARLADTHRPRAPGSITVR